MSKSWATLSPHIEECNAAATDFGARPLFEKI
jgi:hypothetical protein